MIATTPELHSYSVVKVYFAMKENINQIGIAQLGCWLVGEFGEMLINGQAQDETGTQLRLTPEEIIDTYVDMLDENDRKGKRSDVIISWALTALSKLTIRLPKVQNKIKNLIQGYQDHANVEI